VEVLVLVTFWGEYYRSEEGAKLIITGQKRVKSREFFRGAEALKDLK
jgi:hypothetical protein